jgi:hypothetical protein
MEQWISPSGDVFSGSAYDILLNQKLGEHMEKKIPTDGSPEQKGKSGEVAKADAINELGSPEDPRHIEALVGLGWVQACVRGKRFLVRASGVGPLRLSWCHIASLGHACDSVVFSIGAKNGGVSAGLCGKELLKPAELVIGRLASLTQWTASAEHGVEWLHDCGIKYFE